MHFRISVFLSFLLFVIIFGDEDQWSNLGPYEARIVDIAIHPMNEQVIYIGTIHNGIYETINGGEDWQLIESDILPRCMREIVIHPFAPDTIFVSTTLGLYKSIDSGDSWQLVGLPNGSGYEIRAFLIHADYPNIIFSGGFWQNYKSYDGGRTWLEMDLPDIFANKFELDPIDNNVLYMITNAGFFGGTLWKSADLGDTWHNLHNDMDTTMIAEDIAIDYIDNNIIYIVGGDQFNEEATAMVKSINGGLNWIDITPTFLRVHHINAVEISLNDHNTIYIGTTSEGVWVSHDQAGSWEPLNNGLNCYNILRLEIDTLTGNIYASAFIDGMYKLDQGDDTWEKISHGITQANCSDMEFNYNDSSYLVSTVRNLYRYWPNEEIWHRIEVDSASIIKAFLDIEFDPYYPQNIYLINSMYYPPDVNVFYRSYDNGYAWDAVYDIIPGENYIRELDILDLGDNNLRMFITSWHGLYYSDDRGNTWNLCSNGISPNESYRPIAHSNISPNVVFVGGSNLYQSTDSGLSWEILEGPSGGSSYRELVCDPISPEVLYVSKYGAGLFKSPDQGSTWVDITSDIPHDPNYLNLTGLYVNPSNPQNMFINSAYHGFYVSVDGGISWEPLNEGLDDNYASAKTVIDPLDTNIIFIATGQASVWSITRTGTGIYDVVTLPSQFNITAYPNPFNASTTIRYSLVVPSHVVLDIYNVLGQRVERLADLRQGAGDYSIVWRADELPSGMYFARLYGVDFSQSIKVILLK